MMKKRLIALACLIAAGQAQAADTSPLSFTLTCEPVPQGWEPPEGYREKAWGTPGGLLVQVWSTVRQQWIMAVTRLPPDEGTCILLEGEDWSWEPYPKPERRQ